MLVGLIYVVLNIKTFLDDNFVNNDTKIKRQLNDFLNGKQKNPAPISPAVTPPPTVEVQVEENPTERIIEIDQKQLDETIQNTENE